MRKAHELYKQDVVPITQKPADAKEQKTIKGTKNYGLKKRKFYHNFSFVNTVNKVLRMSD